VSLLVLMTAHKSWTADPVCLGREMTTSSAYCRTRANEEWSTDRQAEAKQQGDAERVDQHGWRSVTSAGSGRLARLIASHQSTSCVVRLTRRPVQARRPPTTYGKGNYAPLNAAAAVTIDRRPK